MGKKANPIGVRLGFNKDWQSHWFMEKRKEYVENLNKDFMIREKIYKLLRNGGVAQINIFRDRGNILIEIYSSRPGVIIGRGGEGTKKLLGEIKKIVPSQKVDVAIKEINNPFEWAALIVQQIAYQLERRAPHRRVMHQIIEEAMSYPGIKGIKIKVSGRLGGQEIARSELLSSGTVPTSTIKADIDFASGEAQTKYGKIGIKVWVNRGEKRKYEIKLRKSTEF